MAEEPLKEQNQKDAYGGNNRINVSLISVDYPTPLTAGQTFFPNVKVRVNSGQLLESRGDMLKHKRGHQLAEFPYIKVMGSVNTGNAYIFKFYPKYPMTAPSGSFDSVWQVWANGNWVGEEVYISSTSHKDKQNRPKAPRPPQKQPEEEPETFTFATPIEPPVKQEEAPQLPSLRETYRFARQARRMGGQARRIAEGARGMRGLATLGRGASFLTSAASSLGGVAASVGSAVGTAGTALAAGPWVLIAALIIVVVILLIFGIFLLTRSSDYSNFTDQSRIYEQRFTTPTTTAGGIITTPAVTITPPPARPYFSLSNSVQQALDNGAAASCIPEEMLEAIARRETAVRAYSDTEFALYNQYNWWQSQPKSTICRGYSYNTCTNRVAGDATPNDVQDPSDLYCGSGVPISICRAGVEVMGPMQFEENTWDSVAGDVSTAIPGPTDRRVVDQAIMGAAFKIKNNSKNTKTTACTTWDATSWTETHLKNAAQGYYGKCTYDVTEGSRRIQGNYCQDICHNYNALVLENGNDAQELNCNLVQ